MTLWQESPSSQFGLMGFSHETQLLVICSRLHPVSALLAEAVARVTDWSVVQNQARRHLILPLVHRHLASLEAGTVPSDVLEALSAECKSVARISLLQRAELRRLVERHVSTKGIRFLTLKGLTLGSRYYGDATLRQGRDIDILIAPERLYELTAELLSCGYRLKTKAAHLVKNEQDLRAYCELMTDVGVVSPHGVLFELHRMLDFTGCQYPPRPDQLFASAQSVKVGDDNYPAMPTTELFIYICYHHGKHQWSRLHWIADLDAVIQHESFDLEAVLRRAQELGMCHVVNAALALYSFLGGAQLVRNEETRFTRAVIFNCLHYLTEGNALPEEIREAQSFSVIGLLKARTKIFLYNWHANTRWVNRLRFVLSVTRGTFSDYHFLPLPHVLFGVYRLVRPVRYIYETLLARRVDAVRKQ